MKWHGVPVLPRGQPVLETELRKLAPAAHIVCLENWCGQPELHRHRLIAAPAAAQSALRNS